MDRFAVIISNTHEILDRATHLKTPEERREWIKKALAVYPEEGVTIEVVRLFNEESTPAILFCPSTAGDGEGDYKISPYGPYDPDAGCFWAYDWWEAQEEARQSFQEERAKTYQALVKGGMEPRKASAWLQHHAGCSGDQVWLGAAGWRCADCLGG